jgi:hypothetical protein
MTALRVVCTALVSVIGLGATAHAGLDSFNPDALDLGLLDRSVAGTPTAFEIAVGAGYTQGIGGAGSAGQLEDMAGPGGSLELQLGMRLDPQLSLGFYGTVARFGRGDQAADGSRAQSATAGLQAVWHGRASRSVDPWVSLGAGWRGLWLTPADAPARTLYGVELARLALGIDYRFSPGFAIAPMIGASATAFVAESAGQAMSTGFAAIHENRLNLYVFTGVLGRFDIGY